jgi:hypothetical protein
VAEKSRVRGNGSSTKCRGGMHHRATLIGGSKLLPGLLTQLGDEAT